MKKPLYMIATIILLAGLGSSALIYLAASNESAPGYQAAGGDIFMVSPDDSKMYRHDLEVYGGKANVLMDKIVRWFEGLWHGRSLALTIACITVFISLMFFFVGRHWYSTLHPDNGD